MTTRKTKPVWLFQTPTARVIYESRADLEADLDLCTQIVGAQPECQIEEVPLVLAGSAPPPAPARKRIEYSAAFEEFWKTHEPKRRKEQTYQEWQKTHGSRSD